MVSAQHSHKAVHAAIIINQLKETYQPEQQEIVLLEDK
jgi:hypothetical protein